MTTVVPGGILAVGRRHQPKHETNDVLNSEGGMPQRCRKNQVVLRVPSVLPPPRLQLVRGSE